MSEPLSLKELKELQNSFKNASTNTTKVNTTYQKSKVKKSKNLLCFFNTVLDFLTK